jgi:hypothetical protein
VWLTVRLQGKGFDLTAAADPVAPEGLETEHGRGIQLMKSVMDEVSFKRGGTEVHMRKGPARSPGAELQDNTASAHDTQENSPGRGVAVVAMPANAGGEQHRQPA